MPVTRWIFASALLSACGDGGGTGPNVDAIADLAGTWTITRWEYSLDSDPSLTADWVALIGLTGGLTIRPDGSFSVTPALPGGFGIDDGQLSLDADSLYWDGNNDEEWVRFTLAGSRLTLWWPEVEVVDIDRDGQPEDVRLEVELRRD